MKAYRSLVFVLALFLPTGVLFPQAARHTEANKFEEIPPSSIDINQAAQKDFTKLPGVGPELARRIVDFREKHGPFHRVEDLLAIRGIGPKKWRKLRPYLRVGEQKKGVGSTKET